MSDSNMITRTRTQEFALELQRLRLRHGQVSFRELADTSQVSKSTVQRMIAGTAVPRWALVSRVLEALGAGDMEVWKERWIQAFGEWKRLDDEVLNPVHTREDEAQDHQPAPRALSIANIRLPRHRTA